MRTAALALAAAMLVVAAAPAVPAFAQSDATVKITDVERVHGTLYDEWTFTVAVTNNHARILEIGIDVVYTDSFNTVTILPECPDPDTNDRYIETVLVSPDRTATLSMCVITQIDSMPDLFEIARWIGPNADAERSTYYIATDPHLCNHIREFDSSITCAVQSLTQLIRDIEPEPAQCAAPTEPARTEPIEPSQLDNTPDIISAIYHRYMNNVVLTFDTPVTLSDGWHENLSVYTETGDGDMTADGLGQYARNIMPDGSQLVWLTLPYGDVMQPTNEITDITLRIAPGTIMYGDGDVLQTVLLPPVVVVP